MDDNWQALRKYLEKQIGQDLAVAESTKNLDPATSTAHYCLVSANRSTLGKMRELEAGRD